MIRGDHIEMLVIGRLSHQSTVMAIDLFVPLSSLLESERVEVQGVAEEELKKLKRRVVSEGDKETVCSVCREEYKQGDVVMVLPCKHTFHDAMPGEEKGNDEGCILPWLKGHDSCPMCRASISKSLESSDYLSTPHPKPINISEVKYVGEDALPASSSVASEVVQDTGSKKRNSKTLRSTEGDSSNKKSKSYASSLRNSQLYGFFNR